MEGENIEEIQKKIGEKVRIDSRDKAMLTHVDDLFSLFEEPETEDIEAIITEMIKDDKYKDIKSITPPTGVQYLYSEIYVTRKYAEILSLAEADDPVAIIVSTVREDSNVYPRPTHIDLFRDPVFKIDPDKLESHIAYVLEQKTFDDIKLIHTSTGARYLYSSLFMNEDHARSLADWNESKEYENP